MLKDWNAVTLEEGQAATKTASLSKEHPIMNGFVLPVQAMDACFEERQEQIDSLVRVVRADNVERVAGDLKRTILTVRVPHEVSQAMDRAFSTLHKPLLMRLSPIGAIKNPLDPTIVLDLDDEKSALDALRMLYAEMYSAPNLATGDKNRRTAVIIQEMPVLKTSFRFVNAGRYTIIEATHGYGTWVAHGEPDRFLFEEDALTKSEHGDKKAILRSGSLHEGKRTAVSDDEVKAAFAFAKPYLLHADSPVLVAKLMEGDAHVCLGALHPIPAKKEE